MVEANRAFRRIQMGFEGATPGTAVAATTICRGRISGAESGEKWEQPDEDRNSLSANMADDFKVGVEAKLNWAGDVNFRDIAFALVMALRGNITPSQPDASNEPLSYLWTIAPARTANNTPDQSNGIETTTIEYGDNLQAYEVEYCFATRLEISGAPNEPCKFSLDITGRQRSDTTFTGELSIVASQRAPFNLAKIYINAAGASLGGTQQTGLLKGFSWVWESQFTPRYTADGNYYFAAVDEDKNRATLTLTYARNTDSDAERTKYEARTTTFIRLQLNGATEQDSGQSNPPYLNLDGAYRYFVWPGMGEENGLSTVQVTAESVYDSTWAKEVEAQLFTTLAALPS